MTRESFFFRIVMFEVRSRREEWFKSFLDFLLHGDRKFRTGDFGEECLMEPCRFGEDVDIRELMLFFIEEWPWVCFLNRWLKSKEPGGVL